MFLQQPHAKGVRLLSCYNDILVLFLCFFKNNVYFCSMRIIKRQTLVEYYTREPKAKDALEDWYTKASRAVWTCYADMKKTFNSVDSVGNQHYVFNIKGNDYRLVVVVKFTISQVLIRFVGTHKEYDMIKDISNI